MPQKTPPYAPRPSLPAEYRLSTRFPPVQIPARPNTAIQFNVFSLHPLPMPRVPLNPSGWVQLCQDYSDKAVAEAVVGIARFGARIGFQGTRNGRCIAQNLLSAGQLPGLL